MFLYCNQLQLQRNIRQGVLLDIFGKLFSLPLDFYLYSFHTVPERSLYPFSGPIRQWKFQHAEVNIKTVNSLQN